MARTEDEIKHDLRPMLGRAGKVNKTAGNVFMTFSIAIGIAAAGATYWRLGQPDLGFGGFMSGLLGLAIGGVVFAVALTCDGFLTTRRCNKLAEAFCRAFPSENGEYQIAVELLKGAEGSSNIGYDLLVALHEDVTFAGETKPVGALKDVNEENEDEDEEIGDQEETDKSTALLGSLKPDAKTKNPKHKSSVHPGTIPLDPISKE